MKLPTRTWLVLFLHWTTVALAETNEDRANTPGDGTLSHENKAYWERFLTTAGGYRINWGTDNKNQDLYFNDQGNYNYNTFYSVDYNFFTVDVPTQHPTTPFPTTELDGPCAVFIQLECKLSDGRRCDQTQSRNSNCIETFFFDIDIINIDRVFMTISDVNFTANDQAFQLVGSVPQNPLFPSQTTGVNPSIGVNVCNATTFEVNVIVKAYPPNGNSCEDSDSNVFTIFPNSPTPRPIPRPMSQPTPTTTLFPLSSLSTVLPTLRPSGESIELCSDNISVNVSLGPNSNPSGSFVNVPLEQSLRNVVDCLDINQGEAHTQASHVWWKPAPLELIFNFGGAEYNIREVYFWNYFGEDFDVDQIDLTFIDGNGFVTGTTTIFPRLGENSIGVNANDIIAEQIDLSNVYLASTVVALLTSSNGEIDFQNFVFRAA